MTDVLVATHWHDDHVRGISTLVRECPTADIAVSWALRTREFQQLVNSYQAIQTKVGSGLDEMYDVFAIQKERTLKGAKVNAVQPANQNRQLFRAEVAIDGQQLGAHVYSLSPSDATITLATLAFGELMPETGSVNYGCQISTFTLVIRVNDGPSSEAVWSTGHTDRRAA